MNLLKEEKILKHVQNIIHEETQLHKKRIDLTVHSIYRYTLAGSLDFGGSEFKPASSIEIDPKKENSDDKYGWWKLKHGSYQVAFNEEIDLTDDMLAIISPHDHAQQAGLIVSTVLLNEKTTATLTFEVLQQGCNIKENARFATAYLISV